MGVSRCITKAIEIGRRPKAEWKDAIEQLPAECPSAGFCTGGIGCRERIADYLRMQWNMLAAREKRASGGRR